MSAVVSVGVFDGLHLGHRAILARALARARVAGLPCVVLSFDPHPDMVLARRFQTLAPLTPIPEKRARLAALGIARLEVLPFTRELAALGPEEFVESHMVRPFAPAVLVVGENFALGRGRSGHVGRLREIGAAAGFEVEAVPLLALDGGPVTSTRIRDLLSEGRVDAAARLLGRRYNLEGRVVHGAAMGRRLGFPTANLRLHEEKLMPRHGIYAAWTRIEGETEWRRAAMSLGVRPTFGGQVPTLEVFILDWDGELHGRDLELELECWLREEQKFDSVPELIEAMHGDVAEARRRLTRREATPALPGTAPA